MRAFAAAAVEGVAAASVVENVAVTAVVASDKHSMCIAVAAAGINSMVAVG